MVKAPAIETLSRPDQQSFLALLADLRAPVGPPPGNPVLGLDFIELVKPIIAWHLLQCGWRIDFSQRKIKARTVYGPGVVEGAVTWVSVAEPDDPLANVQNMTMTQIEALPEDLMWEAKRRLGFPVPLPEPTADPWHTETQVVIDDEPDPDQEEP